MSTMALFGGAISVQLPDEFIDAESFRQVPDNQHVFVSKTSNVSIIIELIQMEDGIQQAMDVHYKILAENSEYTVISQTDTFMVVTGQMLSSKFNTGQVDTVRLSLGLLRLFEYSTDVLISVNDPDSNEPSPLVGQIINSFQLHDPNLFQE
jgi:hypothetical protein